MQSSRPNTGRKLSFMLTPFLFSAPGRAPTQSRGRYTETCLQTAIQMNIPTVDKMDLSSDASLIRREQENDRGCDFAWVSQPVSKRYLRGDASQLFSWIRKFL